MAYTIKEIEYMNKVYRECLKADWTKLDFNMTDKFKKLPKPNVCKIYDEGEVFELEKDKIKLSRKNLHDIVMGRRSVRQYDDVTMSKRELSYLLKLTSSIIKSGPGYAFGVIPTGGATNTLETYVYLNKVEGFKKGLYHYMKDTGNLRLLRSDITEEMVNESIHNQLRDCAVVFYWTTTPYRAEYKYQYVSHKMIAIEAGHACQNLYLAAESIDYGVVAIAAYKQIEADKLLQINPEDEFVVYCATVGKKIKK